MITGTYDALASHEVILLIACHNNSTVNSARWDNNCFVTEQAVLCIFTVSAYPRFHMREYHHKWKENGYTHI